MAQISAGLVKELREKTGAGMMDCKNALVETQGSLDDAVELLRAKGQLKARKKMSRAASDGRVLASVSEDGCRAALVELNCETDFVAKTPDFEALAKGIVEAAREHAPSDVTALEALALGSTTVGESVVAAVAKLGENIQLRRVQCLQAGDSECLFSYIHAGGKIGTLVRLQAADPSASDVQGLGRNLCMHVAAMSPSGISRDDIPRDEVERERVALTQQAEEEGKPPQVVEKMVEGRLSKFFREVVLLEQQLVMDPDQRVEKAVKTAGATVRAIARFQLGEAAS